MTISILYHVAEVLYCLAFVLRDVLWLRLVALAAVLVQLPYFWWRPDPLWEPILWSAAFMAANCVGLGLLIRDRRPVALSEDEERLHNLVFRSFLPRELRKVLGIAEWRVGERGERVIEQGAKIEGLMVMFDGLAHVAVDGEVVSHLRDGQFMGEMSYVRQQDTSADVAFAEPSRYVYWPRDKLRALLAKHRSLERGFEALLGRDMADKLHNHDLKRRP